MIIRQIYFTKTNLLMDTSQEHEITHIHFQLKNSCAERANKHFKSQSSFANKKYMYNNPCNKFFKVNYSLKLGLLKIFWSNITDNMM